MKENSPTCISGGVQPTTDTTYDANIEAAKAKRIDFETMNWWRAGMLMIAETISLGILALPDVLKTVGLITGVLLILGLGAFATYSGC